MRTVAEPTIWWASDWRCPACGKTVPIEPGQDTLPIQEAHVCDELARRKAKRDDAEFVLDLTGEQPDDEHECVFIEEQEPSGRLILPPCIICGLTALDALEQLNTHPGQAGGA